MKKSVLVGLCLALVGTIFLAGGVSASIQRTTSTAVCEACGMEVSKADISTFQVVAADGQEHWACCPICAEVVGIYYTNSEINGKCFATGKSIKITVTNGNFSSASVTPSDPMDNVTVVLGGSCKTNKLVSDAMHGAEVRQEYSWASNASLKTMAQSFTSAKTKLGQMTVSYRAVNMPALNYALIGVGTALLIASPISWKLVQKRTNA
jgi:hypothetical protein